MSAAVTLTLTRVESEALHSVLAVVLNDPDLDEFFTSAKRDAMARVMDKNLTAARKGES